MEETALSVVKKLKWAERRVCWSSPRIWAHSAEMWVTSPAGFSRKSTEGVATRSSGVAN